MMSKQMITATQEGHSEMEIELKPDLIVTCAYGQMLNEEFINYYNNIFQNYINQGGQ